MGRGLAGQTRRARVWICVLALAGAVSAAPPALVVEDGRFDPAVLTSRDPVLASLFRMAQDCGFRLGIYGGPVRDLVLSGTLPGPGSDVDLVFDSRELSAAMKARRGVKRRILVTYWRLLREHGLKTVRRYIEAAQELGLAGDGGEAGLTDELLTAVLVARHGTPGRPRGDAWALCEANRERIAKMNKRFARDIRDGIFDGACAQGVQALLMDQVRARLQISNPKYLKASEAD